MAQRPARFVPRLLASLSLALMLLGPLTVLLVPQAAADPAPQIAVYVGYADQQRANATNFPTPWEGSPNTVFIGCSGGGCAYDAGTIRIVNTGGDLTIDSVKVKLDTCTYDLWGSNISLPGGEQLILTQTAPGASNGCQSDGTFDTSDVGPGGQGWAGVCDQSNVIPEVDVTIGGNTFVFTDSGQVLNTGGVDAASCPPVSGNESTQWTLIGHSPCFGANLSLAPGSQNANVGDTATVAATLTNGCGDPLSNVSVDFSVTAGPNAGGSGSGTTDSNGVATFTYGSAVVGDDTLHASVTNLNGTIDSNDVHVIWMMPTNLTINPPTTQDFNDAVTVSATLTDVHGNPVANEPVTLTLNGTETCSANTDNTGAASCSITPGEAAGGYTLDASFAGDTGASLLGSNDSATFTVTLEETTLTITSSNTLPVGGVTVSAQLLEDGNASAPIGGRTVTFTATPNGGGSPVSGDGTTDGNGVATTTLDLPPGDYSLTATFAGDSYYQPAVDATVTHLFVYAPTQFVIWGGNNADLAQAVQVGQDFTFWGAQWASQVAAGNYAANASFKGYASSVNGTTWTTSPGDASNPPSSVASYIGVIVATNIDKSGSTISGDVAEIVVLKVDNPSGYAPDPGHLGTGVVVAIVH